MESFAKIVVFFTFFTIFITSCNEELTQNINPEARLNQIRSVDEAINIAESAANIFSNGARHGEIRTGKIKAITTSSSRSNSCDTLLYIIDYENLNGYSLVSASLYGEALLAFIEEGKPEDALSPEFSPIISLTENYIQNSSNASSIPSDFIRHKYEKKWVTTNQVGPKVEVRFGPDKWEAEYCPNGDAGMEIIALAQALSYYECPKELSNGSPFDWSVIKLHDIAKHDHSYSIGNNNFELIPEECPLTDSEHLKLGAFIKDLGVKCDADYTSTKTTIDPISIVDALCQYVDNVNWSFGSIADDSLLDRTIENGIGIVFGLDASDQIVLVWVVDGYKDVDIYTNEYINKTQSPYFGWELIDSQKTGEGRYYHYNWGWYGKCNGYFNKKVFDPLNASEYDYNKNNTTDRPYSGLTKHTAILSFDRNEN